VADADASGVGVGVGSPPQAANAAKATVAIKTGVFRFIDIPFEWLRLIGSGALGARIPEGP
jgi:hypothetical protein